MVIKVL